MWVLYIFWRSNPCLRYHWQMFSHTVGSLFILMLLFFKLCISFLFWWGPICLFFPSCPLLSLGDIYMKILLCGVSKIFLPMFSSRTSMVSQLIFQSYPPWNYFCVWCKLVIEFNFPPNTIYWRGYFYSILCFCPLCQILIDHRDLGLFLGSLFCYTSLYVLFLCQYQAVWITVAL